MLLGCAALWGGSYLHAKFAMEAIPPQWLMRSHDGACLCMLALFHRHIVPYLTPKIIIAGARSEPDLLGRTTVARTSACRPPMNRAAAPAADVPTVLTPFTTWVIQNRREAISGRGVIPSDKRRLRR